MHDYPFRALIMGAMRRADTPNLAKLLEAFPEIAYELQERYEAPGGVLAGDELDNPVVLEVRRN